MSVCRFLSVVPGDRAGRFRRAVLVAALVCVPETNAFVLAQEEGSSEDPAQLRVEEQVSVTASRLEQPLLEAGAAVTVLEGADIEASGVRWLHELLDTIPGVTAVRTAGPGSNTSLFLRGASSNHTLVMIDGVEVNSPTTGGYDFGFLPAERIRRVEVLRGPQSTLYGSEAIGGVIQIFTRRGVGPTSVQLEAEGGALATGSGALWAGGGRDAWSWSVGASYLETRGISSAAVERGATEDDGLDELSFDGSLGYRPSPDTRLELFVRGHDADGDIDGFVFGFGPADDPNYTLASRQIVGGARLELDKGLWSGRLQVAVSKLDSESDDPDGAFFLGSEIDAWSGEIDLENRLRVGERHTLVAGVEARRETADLVSRSPFGDATFDESIDTFALYAEDRIEVADELHVTAGGRFEQHELFGSALTFRATGSARLSGVVRLHASAGSGFRAPSLNDLFFPGFGNPDLDAERSVGWDAGVEAYWSGVGLRLDATYFRQEIEDLIQFSPARLRAENLGEADSRGLETTLQWSVVPGVRMDASYTFNEAEAAGTDIQLVRRPRHQGAAGLTVWPTRALRLHARLLAKGARLDDGPSGLVELGAYVRADLAGSYRLTPELELKGRIENLFDRAYREVFGFGVPGRSLYAGLRWRMGGER